MFYGITQRTRLPQTAEHLLKLRKAFDEHRLIDGASQGSADERRTRRTEARDGLIRAALFVDLKA